MAVGKGVVLSTERPGLLCTRVGHSFVSQILGSIRADEERRLIKELSEGRSGSGLTSKLHACPVLRLPRTPQGSRRRSPLHFAGATQPLVAPHCTSRATLQPSPASITHCASSGTAHRPARVAVGTADDRWGVCMGAVAVCAANSRNGSHSDFFSTGISPRAAAPGTAHNRGWATFVYLGRPGSRRISVGWAVRQGSHMPELQGAARAHQQLQQCTQYIMPQPYAQAQPQLQAGLGLHHMRAFNCTPSPGHLHPQEAGPGPHVDDKHTGWCPGGGASSCVRAPCPRVLDFVSKLHRLHLPAMMGRSSQMSG